MGSGSGPPGGFPMARSDLVSLETDCARALFRAARAVGVGSRQQVRAAVRAFVRRHRRDRGFLIWTVRCAGASSALAIALLGLSVAPASARSTVFLDRTGSS